MRNRHRRRGAAFPRGAWKSGIESFQIDGAPHASLVLIAALSLPARADDWFAQRSPVLDLYHHLHSHPETVYHKPETSERLPPELQAAGAEVTTGVGKFGVVGVLKNGPGPTVLVRSDLDASPSSRPRDCRSPAP